MLLLILSLSLFFPGQPEPLQVGDSIPVLNLRDQHGEKHVVEPGGRWLVIAFDKPGAGIAQKWLRNETDLATLSVTFVLDASQMKEKIREKMVLPRLRKINQRVLIVYDTEFRNRFPWRKRSLTALKLNPEGIIQEIHFVEKTPEINALVNL